MNKFHPLQVKYVILEKELKNEERNMVFHPGKYEVDRFNIDSNEIIFEINWSRSSNGVVRKSEFSFNPLEDYKNSDFLLELNDETQIDL